MQSIKSSLRFDAGFENRRFGPISKNHHVKFVIAPPFDIRALQATLSELAQLHEILRTTVREDDDGLSHVILPACEINIPILEISIGENSLVAADELIQYEIEQSIDFESSPWRAKLFRLAHLENLLVLTFHPIVFDHWSEAVLANEILTRYAAHSRCRDSKTAPVHGRESGNTTAAERFERQLEFWKAKVAHWPEIRLLTQKSEQDSGSLDVDEIDVDVPSRTVELLRQLGQSEQIPLASLLLAAWCVLIYRYSGQSDLMIGWKIGDKCRSDLNPSLGLFQNILPLRISISADEPFQVLMQNCRSACQEVLKNWGADFVQVVNQALVSCGMDRAPAFAVQFGFQTRDQPQSVVNSVTHDELSTADIMLDLSDSASQLTGTVLYRSDRRDRMSVQRMSEHWLTILRGMTAHLMTPVDRVPLLTDDEQTQMTIEWNDTFHSYDRNLCLTQLFENRVAQTPDATALIVNGERITYHELNQRANRLANHLRCRGAKPDSLIGLYLERSANLIVSMLAILKSGAAYLPLDPTYPSERCHQVLTDAEALFVITEERLVGALSTDSVPAICVDRDGNEWSELSGKNLLPSAMPDHLAYVIYTSGSTGKPKGVEVRHQGVVNFLQSMQRTFEVKSSDQILAITTITFDISVLEIFLPLVSGAAVELIPREIVVDGCRLRSAIERSDATILQATPMTWRILFESGWKGNRKMRLLCGGEALPCDLVPDLLSRGESLWNMFGPTETTVWSTLQKIESSTERITVGRPIANTQAYILDRYLQPVPIGVMGELYLGGDGVARGYRGRPDLTSERFVRNPFSDSSTDRIYKTGDVARYQSDGSIEHLGRIDHQVKLRGYRIELGEIESTLCGHDAVSAAAVILWNEDIGNQYLAAYVIADANRTSATELIEYLKDRLPEYMVPPAITFLSQMPLTSSGKVDRRSLPSPEIRTVTVELPMTEDDLAQSEFEAKIESVWCEALRLPRIPRDMNFFELGGHSLLALRIALKLSESLDRPVPVTLLFCHPTIASLAKALESSESYGDEVIVPLRIVEGTTPLFLIPPIGAELFSYRNLLPSLKSKLTIYGVNFWHPQFGLPDDRSMDDLARRCAEFIKEVQSHGPYSFVGYSFGGILAFEIARVLVADGEHVQFLGLIDTDPGVCAPLSMRDRLVVVQRFLQKLTCLIRSGVFWKTIWAVPEKLWRRVVGFGRRLAAFPPREIELPKNSQQVDGTDELNDSNMELRRRQQFDAAVEARYRPRGAPIRAEWFRAEVRPLIHSILTELHWSKIAIKGIRLHEIRGDHITIMHQPEVSILTRAIDEAIDRSCDRSTP